MKTLTNPSPPTHVFSTRLDIRSLATLSRFWLNSGERPRSASDLIRLSLETFTKLLVENGKTSPFTSISEAEDFLSTLNLTIGRRQPKNIQDLGISLSTSPQPTHLPDLDQKDLLAEIQRRLTTIPTTTQSPDQQEAINNLLK